MAANSAIRAPLATISQLVWLEFGDKGGAGRNLDPPGNAGQRRIGVIDQRGVGCELVSGTPPGQQRGAGPRRCARGKVVDERRAASIDGADQMRAGKSGEGEIGDHIPTYKCAALSRRHQHGELLKTGAIIENAGA